MSKMPIFRIKSVKSYTGQKKFTRTPSVASVTNIRYGVDPYSRTVTTSTIMTIPNLHASEKKKPPGLVKELIKTHDCTHENFNLLLPNTVLPLR